jgi:hypothetical protein
MEQSNLYWIHLPEHTDILLEGYIGVSRDPIRRLSNHKTGKRNPHLTNAFAKYKDIIHTILLQGEEEYCYEIEEKLRPTINIGWNITSGGNRPPILYGENNHMKQPEYRELTRQRNINNNPMKNPEIAAKSANNSAKDHPFINPQGKSVLIHNLEKFCRENNLDHSCMYKVISGKRNQHKGWTI